SISAIALACCRCRFSLAGVERCWRSGENETIPRMISKIFMTSLRESIFKVMNTTVAADLPKEMQAHHYPILYQVEERHWWYVGRRRIIQSLVQKICTTLNTSNPRILDVGCGTGANLKILATHGQAEGVDISQQAVDFCRERGLESVKLGAAEDLPYENDSFDLVTALDVVEHLDDDVAGLREMRRVLRRDGRLLLFVPAFMFLWGVQDDVS